MKKDNFNNQEEISKILKELPKVDAPDNFEFNLMTKINNGNFDNKKYKESSWEWSWTFAPATALVLSAVLVFFVFDFSSDEIENPLLANPPLRAAISSNSDTLMSQDISKVQLSGLNQRVNEQKSTAQNNKETFVVVVNPNDVVEKKKVDYNFNLANSVNLDNKNLPSNSGNFGNARVVSGGNLNNRNNAIYFDFKGFLYRNMQNQEMLLKEKARIDSINNARKEQVPEK